MAVTYRNLRFQADATISSETTLTLSAHCYAVTLCATTAAVNWRPAASEATDIFTLPVGVPVRIQSPELAGAALLFISATGGIQLIEELKAV